jgi:threonine dehydrogenase-like Zn-dependent dehydrogenase
VVLFGCGLVGALVLQVLKRSGADRVAVVEPDAARRQLAESLGADVTADPSRQDLQHALRTAAGTAGADLVIETAASGSVFPSAFEVLRVGGRLVCTSTFLDGLSVPLYPDIVEKELTVIGAHQPKCPPVPVPYYPYSQFENRARGLEWMARGILKTDELITHRVPAAEAPAFYARLAGDRSILGAVIDWPQPGGSL